MAASLKIENSVKWRYEHEFKEELQELSKLRDKLTLGMEANFWGDGAMVSLSESTKKNLENQIMKLESSTNNVILWKLNRKKLNK